MQTITLSNVLPHVFEQRNDLKSEIWKQDVKFEKEKLYLVEAMSGTGKSTLCSYILGYRHDYTGSIHFDQDSVRSLKVNDWVNIRQNSISHLFQELRLFPELTALENIQIKNDLTNFKPLNEIKDWFELLGIADKLDAKHDDPHAKEVGKEESSQLKWADMLLEQFPNQVVHILLIYELCFFFL